MTTTSIGSGIEAAEMFTPESNPFESQFDIEEIKRVVRDDMRGEFAAAVSDIERRLKQAREIERSSATTQAVPRSVHAEDLNISRPLLDGYLLTANAPSNGSIQWSSLHVVLLGVDYTIVDGSTANKYAWFIKPESGTSVTLTTGNTLPTLGQNDALIFVNNGGVPVSALETSISYAVGPGVIGNAQLATDVSTILSTLQANDIAQQSALDGAISTYYQNDPPWPAGQVSPQGGPSGNAQMGDIWYDANDNGAYRWTGASGSPANFWAKIADTDNSALAGKINTKVTTYLVNNSPGPVAPSGGFTTGDLWMVLDMNNLLRRWNGSAWVDLQLGDAAISSIGGAKVGSGINGANVTSGTIAAVRIGAGVAGAALGTATGQIVNSQLAPNAVQPKNINAAFHLLY